MQAWVQTWDQWHDQAKVWVDGTSEEDKTLASMLRIPTSFAKSVPTKLRCSQHHTLYEVVPLWGPLPMPPRRNPPSSMARSSTSANVRHGKLMVKALTPNPTARNLLKQTWYQPKEPKRSAAARPLAEVQVLARVLRLETQHRRAPNRDAALRMCQVINSTWASKHSE